MLPNPVSRSRDTEGLDCRVEKECVMQFVLSVGVSSLPLSWGDIGSVDSRPWDVKEEVDFLIHLQDWADGWVD